MAELEIDGASLVIRLSWLERLGALSGEPRVPLIEVENARYSRFIVSAADPTAVVETLSQT